MSKANNETCWRWALCQWVLVDVTLTWLTSLSSQAHPIGQNREAGIIKETAAAHIHLWGLQSKLLQLLGQQAKLFTLAATLLLQISYLWLHREDTSWTFTTDIINY